MCFLVFEGMDGAGKTTVSEMVGTALTTAGHDVVFINKKNTCFNDPYVTQHMMEIKKLMWEYDQQAPLQLLGESHWLHLMASWFSTLDYALIRPNVSLGKVVIVDSWVYKFIARYVLKGGRSSEEAHEAFRHLSKPDLTIFLDVDPQEAARRKISLTMAECGNMDGYRGINRSNFIAYQTQIRNVLYDLCIENRWIKINTSDVPTYAVFRKSFDEVVSRIEQYSTKLTQKSELRQDNH